MPKKKDAEAGQPVSMGQAIERKLDCDREAWLKDRILTAMRMAIAVRNQKRVDADSSTYESALEGISNGAAIEISHQIFGQTPEYINLRPPVFVSDIRPGYSQ